MFLRAAKAHDCALMSYLSVSESETWCPKAPTAWADGRPELLAYRNVGKAFAVSAEEAGRASVITQRWMNGADPGTMEWGWCWVRTHDGWRLYDQGQG
ncbi:hypothetical protein ACRQ4C_13450 [Curtobacterium sp. SP.BCp]|uniref:hypothetical protein n=1 Tax=Curtobacterium sp. SP.BCp TaxID=3435230 RepID=UPI003F7362E2